MRWQFRGRAWRFEACDPVRLMGVLNVTPDSFSDGGQYLTAAAALEQALALVEAGADIIDVGGESSRPGAEPVPVELELERVVPLVRALRVRSDVVVSVDTTKAAVARAELRELLLELRLGWAEDLEAGVELGQPALHEDRLLVHRVQVVHGQARLLGSPLLG